jgi:hypothetical protein
VKVALPLLVAALAAAAQAVSAQTLSTVPASTQGPAPAPRTTSPFFGGVPSGTPTSEPITLTVINAIVRALDHNLGVLTAEEAIGRARGARWNALSELLPNVLAISTAPSKSTWRRSDWRAAVPSRRLNVPT